MGTIANIRRLADETINGVRISTIHRGGSIPEAHYESAVFGGPNDGAPEVMDASEHGPDNLASCFYSTEAEAREGHAKLVKLARAYRR